MEDLVQTAEARQFGIGLVLSMIGAINDDGAKIRAGYIAMVELVEGLAREANRADVLADMVIIRREVIDTTMEGPISAY